MAIIRQAGERRLRYAIVARLPALAVLLVYLVASMAWLFPMKHVRGKPHTEGSAMSRSCPMCSADPRATRHCSCCETGEECECGLSAQGDDTDAVNPLETGILSSNPPFLPLLVSRPVLTLRLPLPVVLRSNVPTPPPEGWVPSHS